MTTFVTDFLTLIETFASRSADNVATVAIENEESGWSDVFKVTDLGKGDRFLWEGEAYTRSELILKLSEPKIYPLVVVVRILSGNEFIEVDKETRKTTAIPGIGVCMMLLEEYGNIYHLTPDQCADALQFDTDGPREPSPWVEFF